MLPSCFDYIFVHSRQKARFRPELSPKFLSTLGPNPTRKARPDLQLWYNHFSLVSEKITWSIKIVTGQFWYSCSSEIGRGAEQNPRRTRQTSWRRKKTFCWPKNDRKFVVYFVTGLNVDLCLHLNFAYAAHVIQGIIFRFCRCCKKVKTVTMMMKVEVTSVKATKAEALKLKNVKRNEKKSLAHRANSPAPGWTLMPWNEKEWKTKDWTFKFVNRLYCTAFLNVAYWLFLKFSDNPRVAMFWSRKLGQNF